MPHSHHSHSGQFCRHAKGLLEDVILEAIRQGFQVYGLTEHVPRYRVQDLYPEEKGLPLIELENQFDAFLEEAHRLKEKYASEISILVGLETEFVTKLDLDRLELLLERKKDQIEYVVGSVHHVHETPIDFDQPTFERALSSTHLENKNDAQECLLSNYFDAQFELLQRIQPEVIGHFDLCRLYNPELRFSDIPAVWRLLERNIIYAVEYGALFEINAAAFRKNWDTAYPGEDVVRLILKRGGRFVLSDDSHGPQVVGLNYDRLLEYLKRVRISEIWYLRSRTSPDLGGRLVEQKKLSGDWWEHHFWKKYA